MNNALLVTGASGFIGARLVDILSAAGFRGVAVSRCPRGSLPAQWQAAERHWILQGQRTPEVHTVIHLEAKHHVFRLTPTEIAQFHNVNVEGTRAWLDFSARQGVQRFIYFSSIKAVNPVSDPVDESASGPGPTHYGASKWTAEREICQWVRAVPGRSALVLRPAVVYGPGNRANIYSMIQAIARGRFPLIDGGVNIKSVVSIDNVCAAVVHLLRHNMVGTETFNLVDARSFSVCELARMIAVALDVGVPERSLPLGVARVLAAVGDLAMKGGWDGFPINSSRLEGLIEQSHFSSAKLFASGFNPIETTEQGLQRMVGWFRTTTASGS